MKNYKILLEKTLWSLAPLIWGAFVWFMTWGFGSFLIPYYSLNYLLRVIVASFIIIFFFRSTLNNAMKNYELQFFDYSIKLPPWWFFILLAFLAACFSFTSLFQFETMQSIIGGVLVSAIIEEFIARSFFIKYKMHFLEFILFNIISSLTFTFMHAFYVKKGVEFFQLLQQTGHFSFSFMLGIIIYKTQRIEFSIILHMISNFLRYTIPVCILNCPYPSLTSIILSMFVDIICLLSLGGCSYKQKLIK